MAAKQKGGKGVPAGPRCVQNEMSGFIIEAIEPEEFLGKALLTRVQNIASYPFYGPPDMCYFVKEKKGGFMSSGPSRQGYYHHVYGVDTSSTASPSAYIRLILSHESKNQAQSKKAKVKTISATYCTYDIVTRRDIRVEICFPGSTNVVAYDADGERSPLQASDWNYVFVSSQIRSSYAKHCYVGRLVPQFINHSTFNDFLAVVKLLYREDVLGQEYIREKELDPLRYGTSFLLSEVTGMLIRSCRTEAWQTELTEMAITDPHALFYLVDIFIARDRIKEALTMLAKQLIKHPMMVHLLFKQAQCLLKYKYYEYAVKVAKVCVDLCPTSFEGWILYAECLIGLGDLKMALIAFDLAPNAPDPEYVTLPEPQESYDLLLPSTLDSSDSFSHFMLPLENVVDYGVPNTPSEQVSLLDLCVYQRLAAPFRDDIGTAAEQAKLQNLIDINERYLALSESERRIYDLISLCEREVGLTDLVEAKTLLFYTSTDKEQQAAAQALQAPWQNPFFQPLPASY